MNKNITTFEETVEKLNIYEPLNFEYLFTDEKGNKYINAKVINMIKNIILPTNDKVYLICPVCGDKHTFYVHSNYYTYRQENNDVRYKSDLHIASIYNGRYLKTMYLSLVEKNISNFYYDNLYDDIIYIDFLLRCSHDNSHIQIMQIKLSVFNGNIQIVKIAQDPINTSLVENNSKKYEKQLKKFEVVIDYRHALQSKARNLYAGATTYLRRIYEKMINYYMSTNNLSPLDNHMESKVDCIKQFLSPDFIAVSKNLYTLLSKSIHELSNDEISSYYLYLDKAIEFQLAYQKFQDDQAVETDKIKRELNEAINKLKNE